MTSTDTRNTGRRPRTWLVIACAASAVAGGVVGGVIANAINSPSSTTTTAATASPAPTVIQAQGTSQPAATSCAVPQVAKEALPSVVTIQAQGAAGSGTGSGEIIRSDGYILTNNHVVVPAADGGTLSVQFSNGKTVSGTLTGRDPLTDVAVIKVNQSGLPAIPIGSSGTLVVGQPVVVLGAPLGLTSTVTSGIVSALNRTIQVPGENSQSALLLNAIQTDAAINPGNSGGAMVNCDGKFVGMPSAGATVPSQSGESSGGSIGLGFAIPADLAIAEANEIIATGKVSHAYFGLQAAPVSADTAQAYGVAQGLLVTGLDQNGPAQAAGLRTGDIITTVNGQPAVSTDQIVELTISKHPGDKVTLGYQRDGTKGTATVTLAAHP